MEPADVEFRQLGDVPKAEIVELLRVCLGDGSRRSEEFWRWKHEDNPFGRSPGVAAYVGDALAGIRVFLRWQLASGESTLRAVRPVDTATHPSWRRLGLFRRMTLALVEQMHREGVDLVFNTPNARSEAGYVTMGWQALGRVSMLVRPAAPWTWPRGSSAGKDAQKVNHSLAGSQMAALFDEPGLEALLSRASGAERRLHTPRTAPYLRWRYLETPGLEYSAKWRIDRAGSGAVIIARSSTRSGLRALLLSEVLVSPDAEGGATAASLFRALPAFGEHHYAVAHAAASTPERRALLRAGFAPVPWAGPRLTVRHLNAETVVNVPVSTRSWRLGLGDLEVF